MAIPFKIHPCLNCGACCAFFRVSFHWSETLAESHGVPMGMTTKISPHLNAISGTNQTKARCIAFQGVIRKSAKCKIYSHRPSCCRKFKASLEDGEPSLGYEEARKSKGLDFLTLTDWDLWHSDIK